VTTQVKSIRSTIALGGNKALQSEAQAITPQEFLTLYDEYFQRVYNYVRYRCGDPHTADDLTAAVFEQALRRLRDYCPQRGSFKAWLFIIARSTVSHHLRSDSAKRWLPLDEVHEIPDEKPTPEESVTNSEAQKKLLVALSRLSERDRDILSLKFAARLTNRRIAEITGLSDNNVGIILYRAIHKLRILFDEKDLFDERRYTR
jgi:RNA polymerase sigma factor (sigma-70 family)